LAGTFHTHLTGSGLPSTSSSNAAGSSDKGDTLGAVLSQPTATVASKDVYVISGEGLAHAPTGATEAEVQKGVGWVIQGRNFSEWYKALKKRCGPK
jgi:hypothetical protein